MKTKLLPFIFIMLAGCSLKMTDSDSSKSTTIPEAIDGAGGRIAVAIFLSGCLRAFTWKVKK